MADAQLFKIGITQTGAPSIVLLFSYLSDETLSAEADITDNYVETNYAIQDHIALKPRTIRLKGYVGEVIFQSQDDWMRFLQNQVQMHPLLQSTVDKCAPLLSLIPTLGSYTSSAIAIVNQLQSSFDRYRDIYNTMIGRQTFKGRAQKEIVTELIRTLNAREPVEIGGYAYKDEYDFSLDEETSKYYLQSVIAHQGDSQFISDIEIVIKEIRIAETQYTKIDSQKYGSGVRKTTPAQSGSKPKESIATQQIEKLKKTATAVAQKATVKIFFPAGAPTSPTKVLSNALLNNPALSVGKNVVKQMQNIFVPKGWK